MQNYIIYFIIRMDVALAAVALGCNLGRDHSFEIHTAAIRSILYIRLYLITIIYVLQLSVSHSHLIKCPSVSCVI